VKGDFNEAAGDLALSLEPSPEEMPAIETSTPVTVVDDRLGGTDATTGKRRKKSKAEAAADHDAEIVAAIESTAHPDVTGEELPSPELLAPVPPRNSDASKRELDAMGLKLMDALRTFRVDGELVGRTTGPVVSQFEIEPAPGVKVRQFANLSNDLALAMRAASIRVVAPIPGRGAVGVERRIPCRRSSFRELIETRDFQSARAAAAASRSARTSRGNRSSPIWRRCRIC
jgi:S-DNA-T family DNA segregation ATPase FtsK/SpoIIIE